MLTNGLHPNSPSKNEQDTSSINGLKVSVSIYGKCGPRGEYGYTTNHKILFFQKMIGKYVYQWLTASLPQLKQDAIPRHNIGTNPTGKILVVGDMDPMVVSLLTIKSSFHKSISNIADKDVNKMGFPAYTSS